MELIDALRMRHSYRGEFRREPIPSDHLEQIVEAGLLAPSGKNLQTTRFVIVDDPELLDRVRALAPDRAGFRSCAAMIVCLIDREPEAVYGPHHFQIEDCAAAVENMLLVVTALGYATVWTDGFLRVENRAQRIAGFIGAPEGKEVRVVLPLGVPVESCSQPEKLPFDQRAWFNRYGES